MLKYTLPPMRLGQAVCPNSDCDSSGRTGIHSYKERRYICHGCKRTVADTSGTLLYRLKQPLELVLVVVPLLAYGCPILALVVAFGLDERTIAAWQRNAGQHAKTVQEYLVCQAGVDLGQVQANELYTKTQAGSVWIATAMTVFSRLWLWGAMSWTRDEALIRPVIEQTRAAGLPGQPILLEVDGFKVYVSCILQVFRDPLRTGTRGRPRLVIWENRHIVQVVKHRVGKRLLSISRRLAYGSLSSACAIMQATQVELGCINTAYIERLNATLRTWIPALVRRTRTPSGARPLGSRAVLDGMCVQLLSGACDADGYAGTGG